MSLLKRLPHIVEESKAEYLKKRETSFIPVETFGTGRSILALGDNLSFLSYLAGEGGFGGKLKMIYGDPPFFSRSKYAAAVNLRSRETGKSPPLKIPAYDDVWSHEMGEYLQMLAARLWYMKDLLSREGLIWLHLDWHAVHYVKVIMDEIFGRDRFVNEIIWHYKSGGSSKKHFSRKHDTILLYSKTKDYRLKVGKEKSYNRKGKPYGFKGVEEFCDEAGWYTMVNQKDVWQIDMVGRTSGERTGYATQKPLALLRKIIQSSTDPGDLCGDFFCGSGSLAAAAVELDRNWICCDRGKLAVATTESRILGGDYTFFMEDGIDAGPGPLPEGWDKVKEVMERDPESMILYRTEKRVVDVMGNMIY